MCPTLFPAARSSAPARPRWPPGHCRSTPAPSRRPPSCCKGPSRPVAISSANSLAPVTQALELMLQGSDTLDAAVEGVKIQELDPNDNSVGYGGLPNEDGVVQLDASCMHGPTRRAGAVGALEGIKTPSEVARLVLKYTNHIMLVGEGAKRFALSYGFQEEDLLTPESRQLWLHWRANRGPDDDWLDVPDGKPMVVRPTGTINLNVINAAGDLSSVTTTSGLAWKIRGRVGDSPIVGAGQYTDNDIGAAGSTGRGESNIMVCGGFLTVDNMRRGMAPTDACLETLATRDGDDAAPPPGRGRPAEVPADLLRGQQARRLRLAHRSSRRGTRCTTAAAPPSRTPPTCTRRSRCALSDTARPVIALFLVAAAPAAAQSRWLPNYYPYIASGPNTFPLLGARFDYRRDAEWDDPWLSDGSLAATLALGFDGSQMATRSSARPGSGRIGDSSQRVSGSRTPAWATTASATTRPSTRRCRTATATTIASSGGASADASRSRAGSRATSRRPIGWRSRRHAVLGAPQSDPLRHHGGATNWTRPTYTGSLRLVFDTRDREYNPTRGTLLEAGGVVGDGYGRFYGEARGFVSPFVSTVVAGRLTAVSTGGTPPLSSFYELQLWEDSRFQYGGQETNRGLAGGRRIDADQLSASLEVRQTILDVGDFGAVGLIGFIDAGRVFPQGELSLTTDGVVVTGGGGLLFRALKAGIMTLNFAGGPDGFVFSATTGWSF